MRGVGYSPRLAVKPYSPETITSLSANMSPSSYSRSGDGNAGRSAIEWLPHEILSEILTSLNSTTTKDVSNHFANTLPSK
jgi:hypothetical protein